MTQLHPARASTRWLVLWLRLSAIWGISAATEAAGTDQHAVAMWEEPRHQLIFRSGAVRLMSVNIPAGDTTVFHTHEFPTVYIVINQAVMAQQMSGGDWQSVGERTMPASGTIIDRADYLDKPFTHRVRNDGTTTFQVFAILHQGQGAAAGDDDSGQDLALDNRWFRARRHTLSPGQSTPVLEFADPIVVVQPVDGASDVVLDRHAVAPKIIAGAWSWHAAGTPLRLRNVGETELLLIIIQVKLGH